MPKVKTHKGIAKRFRKTKTGQLMHRVSGQDHFNSRETGKVRKNKRTDSPVSKQASRITLRIPYK
ncbi:MAG: 50S ribosomal protein L35 [Candidatus Doudnabacteria bacterium]|nr:50S ribosomal protein L35 [Candidatus Doudnabacteria bacterium]